MASILRVAGKGKEDHRLEGIDMSQIETNLDKFKESSATGEKKKAFDVLCNSTQDLSLLLSRFKSVMRVLTALQVLEQLCRDGSCVVKVH